MAVATATPTYTRRRFTADEYHRMAEAGILHEDDRVELIEGDIIEMAPIGDPHINGVDFLTELFVIAAAGKVRVSVQNPVRLGPRSEPQPDLLLLRRESVGRGAARPEDVLVLVEIADTSLRYDRDIKIPLYARAVIPQVVIIDMPGRALFHYSEPQDDGYRRVERYGRGQRLVLNVLSSLTIEIDMDQLFG